jgi:FrmR/RcnR family transcriptional regulator, repressor of frmRAB operon
MPYTLVEKKKSIMRLRRIRGQAEALERAVEEGTECGVLLQQIAAMRGAVNGLMAEVLESYMRETFGQGSRGVSEKKGDDGLDAVVALVRSYLK